MKLSEKIKSSMVVFMGILGSFLLTCGDNKKAEFKYQEVDTIHGKNIIADLDKDGRNDIITLIGGESGGFVWYKHKPDNRFDKNVILENVYFRGDRVQISDIDNDGDLDLVAGYRESNQLYIAWLRNPLPDADPSKLNSWQIFKIGHQGTEEEGSTSYVKDIVVADFNRDGKLDVVTRTNTRTRIFFQNTPTDWSKKVEISHEDHEGMDVGDMDKDGDPDIVLNGFWFETPDDPFNESFKRHDIDKKWFTQTEGSWRDDNAVVKVADINGDELLDVLISHSEKPGYPISLYTVSSTNETKSGPWKETKIAEVFDFCQTLDAGDVDNDGDLDIIAAKFERDHGSKKWMTEPPYPVVIFYNVNGDGLKWQQHKLSENGMYAGVLGDVGSDGDLDIVGPRSYWQGPTDMYENVLNDD